MYTEMGLDHDYQKQISSLLMNLQMAMYELQKMKAEKEQSIKHLHTDDFQPKTFCISIANNYNKFIVSLEKTVRAVLTSHGWQEVMEEDVSKHDVIGFVFSNRRDIVVKSIINYRLYTTIPKMLTDKNTFYSIMQAEAPDYIPKFFDLPISGAADIIDNISKESGTTKWLIKDPTGSMGRNVFYVDSSKGKKSIEAVLKNINSPRIQISEIVESILLKSPAVQYRRQHVKSADVVGRRTTTRVVFMTKLTATNISVYMHDKPYTYLMAEESAGTVEADLGFPPSSISNVTYWSDQELKTFYTTRPQTETIKALMEVKQGNFDAELIWKMLVLNTEAMIEQLGQTQYDSFVRQIVDFLVRYLKATSSFIGCKNDLMYNNDFEACFNIYALDVIITKEGAVKVLEVNTSPGTIDIENNEKFKYVGVSATKIFADAFDVITSKVNNTEFKHVATIKRPTPRYTFFMSVSRLSAYPEISRLLAKRGLYRALWRPPYPSQTNVDFGYLGLPALKSEDEAKEAIDVDTYIPLEPVPDTSDVDDIVEDYELSNIQYFMRGNENTILDLNKHYNYSNKTTTVAILLGNKRSSYELLKKKPNVVAPFVAFSLDKDKTNIEMGENNVNNFFTKYTGNQFVIKPDSGSQSTGIRIIKSKNEFEAWIKDTPETSQKNMFKDYTLSLFINGLTFVSVKLNALNIDILETSKPRKAHVRAYFIMSLNESGKYDTYFINKPIIYFAAKPYTATASTKEEYVFLTNLAKTQKYLNILQDDPKMSARLQNVNITHFTDAFTKEKYGPALGDSVYDEVMKKVKDKGCISINILKEQDIIVKCLNKNTPQNQGCYQLVAIDYYINQDDKDVFVLEINQGPGMKGWRINYDLEEIYGGILSVTLDKIIGYNSVTPNFIEKIC